MGEKDAEIDYVTINRCLWNDKVDYHVRSTMYNVSGFLNGDDSLNQIERELLGDLHNKRILHLQCHFGLDSLSLIRHGAAHVTGVDLSDRAIQKAQELAQLIHHENSTRFICCNIYDLETKLSCNDEDLFDIVFTSYGTITWLPDVEGWASIISRYLKLDGKFIMVEFHPVLWMFDKNFRIIEESYFNRRPIVEQCEGTYADRSAPISNPSVAWNHTLSDIIQSLIKHHLRIDLFQEFDYSPYDCFHDTVRTNEGFYQIKGLENKLPMIYSLKATRIG